MNIIEKMFVSIFITIVILFYIYNKFVKIPKELENIPYSSPWLFIWALLLQKPHDEIQDAIRKSFKEGHDIHITRSGKSIYLNITSPEFVKDLLGESVDVAPKLPYNPGEVSHTFFGDGLLFSNGDKWKSHRKLASPAFNNAVTPEMVGETTLEFFDLMKTKLNRPVEAFDMIQRLTLEIIGKLAFGHKFGYLESEETPYMIKVYKFIIEVVQSVIIVSFPWLNNLPLENIKRFKRLIKEFDVFVFDIIEKRRKVVKNNMDADYKDVLANMLKLSETDGVHFDTKSLRDEVANYFSAGHDTTSMALSTMLYYLARYPEMQEKARAEAISILGDEPIIPTSAQLKEMKYINAIVKETLRMYPPVAAVTLRTLTKPIKVGPYVVPENILCSVNIWQIHRHPKFWDNPDQFNPERFMGDEEKRHPFAWIPFSVGRRSCVGQNFSLLEQRVIIPMMLLKYKWTLPENSIHKDKYLLESRFLLKPCDLELVFTERVM